MSQCVPSWGVDDPPPNLSSSHHHLLPSQSHPQLLSDYVVAELTWQNGQLSAHGLIKGPRKYPPTSTSATGTLESVVDQAKLLHPTTAAGPTSHRTAADIDALVPTSHGQRENILVPSVIGSCDGGNRGRKRGRAHDTCTATSSTWVEDSNGGADDFGFAATDSFTRSLFPDDGDRAAGSPDTENTSFGGRGGGSMPTTVADDHDSGETAGDDEEKVTEGGAVRSTVSTKRSRTAAVHNQSERKRRDRINQKMRTLQKLVPNSSKADKASMLDEAIQYMKQLQAQVNMIGRMSSMSPMMMPMGMQQQFHMTMMAQMAQMGMGMGMMDMSSLGRTGPIGISPVMPPPPFLPVFSTAPWDPSTAAVMPDPLSPFVASPAQPQMTMEAYQRMAALYQQMFQQTQHATNPK